MTVRLLMEILSKKKEKSRRRGRWHCPLPGVWPCPYSQPRRSPGHVFTAASTLRHGVQEQGQRGGAQGRDEMPGERSEQSWVCSLHPGTPNSAHQQPPGQHSSAARRNARHRHWATKRGRGARQPCKCGAPIACIERTNSSPRSVSSS